MPVMSRATKKSQEALPEKTQEGGHFWVKADVAGRFGHF